MEPEPFKTKDTALASFLVTKGMNLIGSVPHKDDPKVRVFVFEDQEDRDDLVEDYITGRGMVPAKKYAYSYKIVKRIMFDDQGTSDNIQR